MVFFFETSLSISVAIWFCTLNISVASGYKFIGCIETKLSFSNKFWNEEIFHEISMCDSQSFFLERIDFFIEIKAAQIFWLVYSQVPWICFSKVNVESISIRIDSWTFWDWSSLLSILVIILCFPNISR